MSDPPSCTDPFSAKTRVGERLSHQIETSAGASFSAGGLDASFTIGFKSSYTIRVHFQPSALNVTEAERSTDTWRTTRSALCPTHPPRAHTANVHVSVIGGHDLRRRECVTVCSLDSWKTESRFVGLELLHLIW